jgi:uncharacterized protein YbjT (DUF2867 family)
MARQAGQPVRVLVRTPHKAEPWQRAGAEVALGDYLDRERLMAAHQGVERVFLVLPLQFDFELYRAYARNAIEAAAAGIQHLVFNTSSHVVAGAQVNVYRVKRAMIDYLQACGVPSTILRPTFYMDNFSGWSSWPIRLSRQSTDRLVRAQASGCDSSRGIGRRRRD